MRIINEIVKVQNSHDGICITKYTKFIFRQTIDKSEFTSCFLYYANYAFYIMQHYAILRSPLYENMRNASPHVSSTAATERQESR